MNNNINNNRINTGKLKIVRKHGIQANSLDGQKYCVRVQSKCESKINEIMK